MTALHSKRRGFAIAIATLLFAGVVTVGASAAPSHRLSATITAKQATKAVMRPRVKPPREIAAQGSIHFCTDPTGGPPGSYLGANGEHLGSDMDIARYVAGLMRVKADIRTISFSEIVPLLNSGECDAYIGGISITPARQLIERFAIYGQFGTQVAVEKGNPKHVQAMTDLSGLTVATTVGTVQQAQCEAINRQLAAAGKPQMTIRAFPSAGLGRQALLGGQVDALVGGYTALIGTVQAEPDKIQLALPGQVYVLGAGIASAMKRPKLNKVFREAIHAMYRDGSMKKIVTKWKIQQTMLDYTPNP